MLYTASPLTRIWHLVKQEKSEITSVYFYALLNGLIQLSLPVGIQAIIGFVLGNSLSTSLIVLIALVVAGVCCNGLLQIAQMNVIEKVQQKIFVRFSFDFAGHLPRLDLQHVDPYYLPELVNRFFEIPNLQKGLTKLLLDMPTATIQILFGTLLLSFYHPFFIFFGLMLLVILGLILYSTGSKGLQTSLEESSNKYRVAGWLEEVARAVQSFKLAKNMKLPLHKADGKVTAYLEARTQHFRILLFQYRVLVVFKVVITAAMLIIGCTLLLHQQINIGQFIAAEIIILTIITSVEKIITNLDSVYDVLTSVEKIHKLTEKPVEQSGALEFVTDEPVRIELQQLSFGYAGEQNVFKSLSLSIKAGSKVCLTGSDGAGKTTLLKLLTGMYSGFSGSLLINGLPIGNYNLSSLRQQTGILFSQQDIFEGTLWENITMGNEVVDRNYVLQLITTTELRSFFASCKQGFETVLDTTGKRLPRNVVQKILLVRALAHQPKLLLLDEPWQNVEEPYKRDLQSFILEQLPHTTVIVSSNDVAFAQRCHQVIHLSKPAETHASTIHAQQAFL